ncbi:Rep family protein [Lactococcus lactis]|uniref:Rep family protein n=1 Tax=Lactococcus lactis TaxID=1358 RepID=UPI00288E2FEE|nr:Rep family protein [Lactococcus lactis]MDT2859320.1 Rep family protein [Lactococcus lactis]MDT2861538.1 Rep family protein [Lactococcus lactis]MDT2879001.1 Rep family protein [Lactococcus lactis]MDT2896638.1 Rep family protein [Lactococcus lactis]MDT2907002.1 Rep family protein [Lactococcus lactis]
MEDKRIKQFVFEQQLKAEYWDWEEDKLKLFDDWKENKSLIFEEIYHRLKTLESEKVKLECIALIVHYLDKNDLNEFIFPHVHLYGRYSDKRTLARIAKILGIKEQYIEIPKNGNKYFEENQLAYLTHVQQPDKYQYPPHEVESFGTLDYSNFILINTKKFEKQSATVKRKLTDESLDLINQQILKGELFLEDILADDDLFLLYSNHKIQFKQAFDSYAERLAFKNLKDLTTGKYKLTVMYFQGKSSLGKSYLARTIAQKVREYAEENKYKSRVYSASSSNPFDDYYGEDIILLDDIRPDSLRKADWLKLLDPINTSRMSARFTNKQVVPRLILITNTQLPEQLFNIFKDEALDQYIRRINFCTILSEKQQGKGYEGGVYYQLSQTKRLFYPKVRNISAYEKEEINFDLEAIFSTDNQNEFTEKLLNQYLLPRIYPKTENDFDFLKPKIITKES